MGMVARTRPGCVMPCIGYEFNTIAGGYIFFLDLAIFSTRAYVDKYLLTSLALFFLAANFGRQKSPDHGARRKWPQHRVW
jgi:hypothetical protein